MLPRALAGIRSHSAYWHFRRADWDALTKIADLVTCSIALTDAPHHHAYQRAVTTLLSLTRPTREVHEALVRFLEIDGERPLYLRMGAARYIARHWADPRGLPLLVEQACDITNVESHKVIEVAPASAMEMLSITMALACSPMNSPSTGAVSTTRSWIVASGRISYSSAPVSTSSLRHCL
jgi:hypothetical protein